MPSRTSVKVKTRTSKTETSSNSQRNHQNERFLLIALEPKFLFLCLQFQCCQIILQGIELLQMVQAVDSKYSEYGLPNAETGLPSHDKKLPLPVTTRKTALRDLQNRVTVLKSMGSSLHPKENEPKLEAVKVSGTKRPAAECPVNPPHHQSLNSTAANGHLVYVRRRPEVELTKISTLDKTNNNAYCPQPQPRKLGNQDETTEQKSQMKESKVCISEVAPIPRASLTCFSSGKPSVPPFLGKSTNILQPVDSDYLPVSSSFPPMDHPKRMNNQHWEERYRQLQDLLKILDQSNQEDYVQMLRSLSSVELSRHAVELEKRSIQLSLEEAREIQRVQRLDVLGKYPKNSRGPSTQQGQAEK